MALIFDLKNPGTATCITFLMLGKLLLFKIICIYAWVYDHPYGFLLNAILKSLQFDF